MADQMDSAASSEALRSEDSHYDFPIRINATWSCIANRGVRRDFASVRQLLSYLDLGLRKRKNPIIFLIGSWSLFHAVVCWDLGRLEPAIYRAAMNPDPFGEGFNGAPLLQVNFDHLLALCRQVELRSAWAAAGVDEIQF